MPTNPKKPAVNRLKNVGLLLTITPEVVDYLSANNEAIAHALRYPINFVPLALPKVLSLGKTQINLVFRSLIRTFAQ